MHIVFSEDVIYNLLSKTIGYKGSEGFVAQKIIG